MILIGMVVFAFGVWKPRGVYKLPFLFLGTVLTGLGIMWS